MAHMLVLKITGSDGKTQDHVSENADSLIVGSGPAAAVKVADPKVSALHCMLKVENGQLSVIDLGSEGGTKVGGNAIKAATVIKGGEAIEIGGTKIEAIFDVEGAKADEKKHEDKKEAVKVEAKKEEPKAEPKKEPKGDKKSKKDKEPRPVPVAAGAVGSAARLFNEELPPEETPAPDAKQLEVAMLWGDTLINVKHFSDSDQVLVGSEKKNDFHVFSASVGEVFSLASCDGKSCTLSVPASAGLLLRRGDSEKTREQLKSDGALKASDGAVQSQALTMQLHDRVQVTLDTVSFIVRWVRPHLAARQGLGAVDFYFTKVLTTSFMAGLVILAAIYITDKNAESLSEDLFKNPQRFAKLVIKPPDKEKKKKIEIKKEKEVVKRDDTKYGEKKDEKKKPGVDVNKRENDKKKVMNAGLLALLGGGDGAQSNVFAPGGLGTGINQALGSLKSDSGISDSHGIGGLGSRGTGPGGGGTGLGLGGLGTKGGGRGSGGSGFGINLGDRGKGETRVIPGKTTVTGSCERAIIGKVINRHANEIRYCYEVELNKEPNLAGKITASFTIDPTGAVSDASVAQSTLNNNNVEQCVMTRIRRWKFPEPKGGGVCVINYPWVFKAAGSGDEGGGEE
ncbi:MAG: TonB family protein [Myxococcales bacterium]